MEMSSSTRTTIVAVFAIYTILLLGYSLYSRRAMKEGKGDYISKFYTGGRDGGILMTAMMFLQVLRELVCLWVCRALPIPSALSGWYAVSGLCVPISWYWD